MFSKIFLSTLKRKATVFKSLRFESRFRKSKLSFSNELMWIDGRLNLGDKLRFQMSLVS